MRFINPYQIGWFSTGKDKAARDLLTAVHSSIRQGEIEAEIPFVFCNREPGETRESDLFIRLVDSYHIPLVCLSHRKFKAGHSPPVTDQTEGLPPWRLEYDREIIKRLRGFSADLGVLAGYMLIFGREMCQRYNIINLHPAVPGGPTGTWQEVVWQLIETDARQTGAMMHLVTPELDQGPPVAYCAFPIRGEPFDRYWEEIEGRPLEEIKKKQGEDNALFKLIRKHGLAREFPLITATLKAFSQGRIRITEEKTVVDAKGNPIGGYDLTDEVDEQVRGAIQ